MLKVLIADDEEAIRKGLKKIITSADIGLNIIGEASDGEIALEMAEKLKPDIMLIDINMPFLNGLDFLDKVNKLIPDAITIIISGYDEFEYARKALQLGVFDYILKPANRKKLIDTLHRAIDAYNKKMKEKEYKKLTQIEFKENKTYIQENFLKKCIENDFEEKYLIKNMDLLEIDNDENMWLFIINDKDEILKKNIDIKCYSFYKDEYLILIIKNGFLDIEEIKKNLTETYVRLSGNEMIYSYSILEKGILSLNNAYRNLLKEHIKKGQNTGNISRIINYIKDNYSDPNLSLQRVADEFHVSPSYLSRIINQKIGISFIEYLTEIRLNKAIELLNTDNDDVYIYEIAKSVGYNSQHYFSRIFKSKTGFSPLEYKNKKL
jgi:two-component system response regulator YesN